MKTLKDVRKFLSSIPRIDYGGCGIAALAMYRWLKKNNKLTPDVKIVFLFSCHSYLYDNNRRYAETKEGMPSACSHVGLRITPHQTIDSEGYLKLCDYQYNIETTDEDFLLLAINNTIDWNITFDRSNVKIIAKTLDVDMSDVEIEMQDCNIFK